MIRNEPGVNESSAQGGPNPLSAGSARGDRQVREHRSKPARFIRVMFRLHLLQILILCPVALGQQALPKDPAATDQAAGAAASGERQLQAADRDGGTTEGTRVKGEGDSDLTLILPDPIRFSLPPSHPSVPPSFVEPVRKRDFNWVGAATGSFNLLMMQTAARIALQKKTRDKLDGPFFKDYAKALSKVDGFNDGDSWFTNYVGHPIEGSAAYHIARLNGASRTGGFWWAAAYSTQFELGPWSEASIGNVGVSPVDLIMTPVLGTLVGMTEEWLKTKVERIERPRLRMLGRIALVGRAVAFIATGK